MTSLDLVGSHLGHLSHLLGNLGNLGHHGHHGHHGHLGRHGNHGDLGRHGHRDNQNPSLALLLMFGCLGTNVGAPLAISRDKRQGE